jgi:hypothetical protein
VRTVASTYAVVGLTTLTVISALPGRLGAQARELGSPFRDGVARVSPTALPPSPGPGHVPVVLEGDEARDLHVVERRSGRERAVCVAPCARWLADGGLRLGIGDEVGSRWWSEPLRLTEPTTIELHYVDNALTRAIGFVVLAASLLTVGGAAFDFLDQGPTDPPAVTMVVAGIVLGVSFGLFFVGDGIDVRVHPGIDDER